MKRPWISLLILSFTFIFISTKKSVSFFDFNKSNFINSDSIGTWQATSTNEAPSGRYGHTIIWTGSEMIVWGGYFHINNFLNDGGRYYPDSDTWISTSTENAPIGRLRHTAVWIGEEMIIWGGESAGGGATTNTGGRYNPTTDTWTSMSTNNAPSKREMHSAVWTGEEMIVWGGCPTIYCSQEFNDGGRYNPTTNTWAPISVIEGLIPRHFHQAVWTGDRMLVWGGSSNNQGMSYDPNTDTWTPISSDNAPLPTFQGASVWTGEEMIVWGGESAGGGTTTNTGGRYNPTKDTWTSVSMTDAPLAREMHSAVWTGEDMIVWGGCGGECYNSGGMYDPETNTWLSVDATNAPSPRANHESVWTDDAMIVWGGCFREDGGGCGNATYYNSGGIFTPPMSNPTPTPNLSSIYLPYISKAIIPDTTPTFTPTPANTSTPTPPSQEVQILSNYSLYVDAVDYLHIVGEVQNNTTSNLSFVKITANIFNSSGQLLNAESTYMYQDNLSAYDKTCFNISMPEPSDWSYFQFEEPTYWTDGEPLPDLTVFNDSGSYNSTFGWYEIIGQVRNDHGSLVEYVSPVGTVYNYSDNVIGCDFTFVNSTHLDPGQVSSFKIIFSGRDYSDVTSYRLQVGGNPY